MKLPFWLCYALHSPVFIVPADWPEDWEPWFVSAISKCVKCKRTIRFFRDMKGEDKHKVELNTKAGKESTQKYNLIRVK